MLQELEIALAQVRAGNTAENVLKWNQTNHISKEITKKVYNNIMNSISYKVECILYLWILGIVKYLILTDYTHFFR